MNLTIDIGCESVTIRDLNSRGSWAVASEHSEV